jgi:hypothetical protein
MRLDAAAICGHRIFRHDVAAARQERLDLLDRRLEIGEGLRIRKSWVRRPNRLSLMRRTRPSETNS